MEIDNASPLWAQFKLKLNSTIFCGSIFYRSDDRVTKGAYRYIFNSLRLSDVYVRQ